VVAHVDQAAAFTGAAHSYLPPTVGAVSNISRTREAQNRPNNGNTNGHAATFNDIQLPLVLNYEINAWGRLRRSPEAARATQQASEADLRLVRLTAEATVAIDYYQLRENDQEIRVLDRTLEDLQEALNLTVISKWPRRRHCLIRRRHRGRLFLSSVSNPSTQSRFS
jgi:multidrug efflux system outer membrane protein